MSDEPSWREMSLANLTDKCDICKHGGPKEETGPFGLTFSRCAKMAPLNWAFRFPGDPCPFWEPDFVYLSKLWRQYVDSRLSAPPAFLLPMGPKAGPRREENAND